MREDLPDFWRNLRHEIVHGRAWIDRFVVLTGAVATGLVVVALTLICDQADALFHRLRGIEGVGPFLTLLWTPALTAGLVWWTRRFAPGAAGSGIPQVMASLGDDVTPQERASLVSLKLAMHKIALVGGGVLAGLSIGREGPTVQVGAGVMRTTRRFLSPASTVDEHDLMVAGAAAGIAAAFNTPLGGVMFALEELTRRHHANTSAVVIFCIVLSGLVSVSVFGNLTYFGALQIPPLDWHLVIPGLVVALVAGFAGGLFARLVVLSLRPRDDRFGRWRARFPVRFAAGCGLAVAVIGLATGGVTAGAGYEPTKALLEGGGTLSLMYTPLKFCATWLSTWSGTAAGIFAPSLSIGAGIGHDVGLLMGLRGDTAVPLIALGMVGFLAAVTQAPLTSFLIVMEMVSGHPMVLSLMLTAFVASGVARLMCRPMYYELAALLRPAAPPASAQPAGPAAGSH